MDNNQPTLEQSQQQLESSPVKEEKTGYRIRIGALVIAIILAAAGAFFIFQGVTQSPSKGIDNKKYSGQTTGKMSGYPVCASGEGKTCTITYEYEVDGKTFTKTFNNLDGYDILGSSDAKIYYNPADPNDATLAPNTVDPDNVTKNYLSGKMKYIGVTLLGFAFLLFVDAFIGYYVDLFRNNLHSKLQEAAEKSVGQKKKDDGGAA